MIGEGIRSPKEGARMKKGFEIIIILILGILTLRWTDAFGATIYIPDSYNTIQDGIDEAVNGDILIVRDGAYAGKGNTNIDFKGKSITVRSENGAEKCIIDCQ
jgi:hypothetical protein